MVEKEMRDFIQTILSEVQEEVWEVDGTLQERAQLLLTLALERASYASETLTRSEEDLRSRIMGLIHEYVASQEAEEDEHDGQDEQQAAEVHENINFETFLVDIDELDEIDKQLKQYGY